MRAAGVRRFGGSVEVLELRAPPGLRPDEILHIDGGQIAGH